MPEHRFIPAFPGTRSSHVGTYQRVLPVALERMFENALDWEHLPFLHASTFAAIACEDAGPWGWRARVEDVQGRQSLLELRLDVMQRRWVTRTLDGALAGDEIWTYVIERGPREIEIVVDFHVPRMAAERMAADRSANDQGREQVGRAYAQVYERLYDEDTSMMSGRQSLLDSRVEPLERQSPPVNLGPLDLLRLPVSVRYAGRDVVVNRVGDRLVVYPARCPHQGAPLELGTVESLVSEGEIPEGGETSAWEGGAKADGSTGGGSNSQVENGQVTLICPWHGYRFDLISGVCDSNPGYDICVPFVAWQTDGALWMGFGKTG